MAAEDKIFVLVLILFLATYSEAGINLGMSKPTIDYAMVSKYGFRSIEEAQEFGNRNAGNEEILKELIRKRDEFGEELKKFAKVKRSKQGRWIHRAGMQVSLYTIAIEHMRKPGAGFYVSSIPVKKEN